MIKRSTMAAVAVVIFAPGCDQPSPDEGATEAEPTFTVRDSAGIEIVENHAPAWPAGQPWTIDPEPEIVVTDDSGRLDWTAGLARLADGRVATFSYTNKQLFIFGPSGGLSRTIGREGEGPGEFSAPEGMHYLSPDTLVVWESFVETIHHFDTAGTLLSERSVNYARLMEHGATFADPLRLVLPDGSILMGVRDAPAGAPEQDCSHLSMTGSFQDQEGIPLPGEHLVRIDTDYAAHPFGCSRRIPLKAVGGDPLSVYISNNRDEVHQRSLDGRLVRIIRRTTEPPPVTDRAWEAELENLERIREARGIGVETGSGGERPRRTGYLAITGLLVDTEGYLWTKEWSESESGLPDQWSVFDPEGVWLGFLPVPPNPQPMDFFLCTEFDPCWVDRDFLLMIRRDELGVERVEGYRIRRGG